jgi:hypothetical protein
MSYFRVGAILSDLKMTLNLRDENLDDLIKKLKSDD